MKAPLVNTGAFLGTNLAMRVGRSAADISSQLYSTGGLSMGSDPR